MLRKMKGVISRWLEQMQFTKKEGRILLAVILATIVFTILILIVDSRPLSGSLLRNTYGAGDREEQLQVKVEDETLGDEKFIVDVFISEQVYTEEELQNVFAQCIEEMDDLILGKNESVDAVYYDLNLVTEIPEYGLEVEWSWDPYKALNIYGEIQEDEIDEEGTLVELTAIISYQEEEIIFIQELKILPAPKDEWELIVEEIERLIEKADNDNTNKETIILPDSISGQELTWYNTRSYRFLGILLMGISVVLLMVWRKQQEQKNYHLERNQQMAKDYAQIVHILTLYLGAGMTIKNAWKRIVQENAKDRYAYLEMKHTYHELENGLSESVCYEQFARRCNLRCYQRLGLMLSQNVRKGNKGLTMLLEQEAREAFMERKNRVKEEGEKAGTRLLMPMFLMLVIVLAIVIIPAFVSIQI